MASAAEAGWGLTGRTVGFVAFKDLGFRVWALSLGTYMHGPVKVDLVDLNGCIGFFWA